MKQSTMPNFTGAELKIILESVLYRLVAMKRADTSHWDAAVRKEHEESLLAHQQLYERLNEYV